tara:strand:- start:175 stop:603 length:429 start_codon:yes stop_codon:yes gene_type:complete
MKIVDICNRVYKTLGTAHNECVYQKALIAELWNHGAESIEFEKHIPVFYVDTKNVQHTVGMERIDLLVRYRDQKISKACLIELKATTSPIRNQVEVQQLKKYHNALKFMNIYCNDFYIINFCQGVVKSEVDYVYFNEATIDG